MIAVTFDCIQKENRKIVINDLINFHIVCQSVVVIATMFTYVYLIVKRIMKFCIFND